MAGAKGLLAKLKIFYLLFICSLIKAKQITIVYDNISRLLLAKLAFLLFLFFETSKVESLEVKEQVILVSRNYL